MGNSESAFAVSKDNGTRMGEHVIPSVCKIESGTSAFASSPVNLVLLWEGSKTYSAPLFNLSSVLTNYTVWGRKNQFSFYLCKFFWLV